MSIAKTGISAVGKLVALGVLALAFFSGLAGVVYMSLQGREVQVPDITGKDLGEADKELALLGLKIKKRADRSSQEKPGTVIEELPKPGETVKTGQMILVVTSRGPENGTPPPPATVKSGDQDDSDKIEEMISDKPKKKNANANTGKKKPDTTRDVNAPTDTNSSTGTGGESNSNKSEKPASNSTDKPKPSASPATPKKPDGKTVDSKLNKHP
ncbi:MAG: PASTA domain-containing protein [Acidobacteria bacterium]|nr:PASTA domain-containing protein [Acidobacteriota bacterium]